MTTYYAAVKYAVDDPPEVQRRALEDGIGYVVDLLLDEHGATAGEIEGIMERQIDYAYDVEASRLDAPA